MVGAILLAGGKGLRMGGTVPKQFLSLGNKMVVEHSFDLFLSMDCIEEIAIVCPQEYQYVFQRKDIKKRVAFAEPGLLRQDSVYNGLKALEFSKDKLVCIHDTARPCLTEDMVQKVVQAAKEWGAALLACPVHSTLKEAKNGLVGKTVDRSFLWEAQTPQVLRFSWLLEGFQYIQEKGLAVTDDISLVENLGYPAQIVPGSRWNVKVTSPDDLDLAAFFIEQQRKK